MNYRKNMFALLVAGTLITGCGGGGTDISGGSTVTVHPSPIDSRM